MNKHEDILAKSEQNWHISLYQHLKNVADIASVMAKHLELDPQIALEGALLHDIGKVSPIFQRSLSKSYSPKPGYAFRHEIASLFFISLVEEGHRDAIIEMIVAHHKSIHNDVSELGILDLDQENSFTEHSKDFHDWYPIALDILEALGLKTHPISIKEAEQNYNYAVDYCKGRKAGCSAWRGLLMASDHMASAMEPSVSMPTEELFIKPDLSFYNRQSKLYPLSMIPVDSKKKHTLVTAPTGAGKTDFLLRRCHGRVFYTLPFQASINAMYERFKENLEGTNAQIHLLHAASNLEVMEDKKVEESIMQHHVGASIKVLTPHQMMSIVFGIKGYEAMVMDLKGCDVILDEIHTYSDITQAIVLRIIEILVSLGCRVHVGTATMPSVLYAKILQLLGGSNAVYEVKLDDQILKSFNRHQIYKLENKDEALEIIIGAIKNNQKVLYVCNQVKRAQEIYKDIGKPYSHVKKMLIHSRYKRSDRARLETELKDTFNTLQDKPCIVVSTQVVEVSLDINFDVMITECAPIDALIQRFGRINRKRSKDTIGHFKPIYVIAPPNDKNEAFPYSQEVLQHTYDVLPNHGDVLEETDIQRMIDTVYPNIKFENIDYTGVAFADGCWRLKTLWHHPKSALLETLDFNSAVCIKKEDKKRYLSANALDRVCLEIPVNYPSIAHRYLEQLDKGMHPFVIPNDGYNKELGLLLEFC